MGRSIRGILLDIDDTLVDTRGAFRHALTALASDYLERGADPADIVRALEYFLDAPAVTGQLLCVDGGQHLGWRTPDIQGVE